MTGFKPPGELKGPLYKYLGHWGNADVVAAGHNTDGEADPYGPNSPAYPFLHPIDAVGRAISAGIGAIRGDQSDTAGNKSPSTKK